MNMPQHTMTCNIVVEPEKKDRFFMDMRVYEVLLQPLDVAGGSARSLIWRGLYLAVETHAAPPLGSSTR
jgi:hypothetical protein